MKYGLILLTGLLLGCGSGLKTIEVDSDHKLSRKTELADYNDDGAYDIIFRSRYGTLRYPGKKIGNEHIIATDMDGDGIKDIFIYSENKQKILYHR